MKVAGRCFIAWAFAFILVAAAAGDAPARADTTYLIDTWETDHGLPENSATAMVQTADGYLLFGTFGGLVRFDGVRFMLLNEATTPRVPHSPVVNLHVDSRGRIWLSTYKGTGIVENNTWKPLTKDDGWRGDFVRSFAQRKTGELLLTTFDGHVLEYRDGRLSPLPLPIQGTGGFVGGVDEDGRWWIANEKYVGRWDGKRWESMADRTAGVATGLGAARDGAVWLLDGDHLVRFRGGVAELRVKLTMKTGSAWSLFEDGEGHVWITTHDRGVFRVTIDPSNPPACSMKQWRAGAGLLADGVRFVFEDLERNLWVGTSGGGLNRFLARRFQSITSEQGLPRRPVTSLCLEANGSALIGTYGGGLLRWDGKELAPVPLPGIAGEALVQSVLSDGKGRVWVGTFGQGLHLFENGGHRIIAKEQTGGDNTIALFEDARGRVWISGGQSVAVYDETGFKVFPKEQEATLFSTTHFAQDSAGTIWLSSAGGVMRLEGERFTRVRDERGEPVGRAGLLADEDETMWLFTGPSVLRWRRGVVGRAAMPEGLIAGTNLTSDAQGHVWMATGRGLARIARSELHEALDGGRGVGRHHMFDRSDGLPTLDFAGAGQPLNGRDGRGRLWFATLKGVVACEPGALRTNALPPPAHVEEVSYFSPAASESRQDRDPRERQQRLAGPFAGDLVLSPGSRRIEFRYSGLSYAAPDKVRFQVRLDGLDNDWVDGGTQRAAYYHDLSPGRYTFHVRAANNDGVWSKSPASLAFTLRPYFWQTLWFRVGGAFALAAGGAAAAWWIAHSRQRIRRQGDERFRLVVESSPNAIITANGQGVILMANRQAELSFGYTREEMIGRPVELLIPPHFSASHAAQREGFMRAPVNRPMGIGRDLFGRRKDGEEFPVEVGLSPIQTAQGTLILASITDISERHRAELEAQRQRNEVAHLSRVNMLGELSGSLAHELNQPLASILSNAQAAQRFLAADQPDMNEVREILKDIVDEDKRAGEVIRRLRALLKKGEVQKIPLSLNEVVMEVMRLVRSDLINHGIEADVDLAPDLPAIEGDRVQLQQVVLNLVMNACDAMAAAAPPRRRVHLVTCADDGGVQLRVIDRGCGIPDGQLERIFDPFFTTKPAGMGLGLAVCRTIASAHGGRLWATSNPDGGATLHLTLPPGTAAP